MHLQGIRCSYSGALIAVPRSSSRYHTCGAYFEARHAIRKSRRGIRSDQRHRDAEGASKESGQTESKGARLKKAAATNTTADANLSQHSSTSSCVSSEIYFTTSPSRSFRQIRISDSFSR